MNNPTGKNKRMKWDADDDLGLGFPVFKSVPGCPHLETDLRYARLELAAKHLKQWLAPVLTASWPSTTAVYDVKTGFHPERRLEGRTLVEKNGAKLATCNAVYI